MAHHESVYRSEVIKNESDDELTEESRITLNEESETEEPAPTVA